MKFNYGYRASRLKGIVLMDQVRGYPFCYNLSLNREVTGVDPLQATYHP